MNYYRNNIKHIKGDTYSNAISITGLEGQELESIYFTCRDSLNDDSEILFEKSLGDGITLVEYDDEEDTVKYAVRVAPRDTKNIQAGTYYYDLQVGINGDIFTIMRGEFILEQESAKGE